MILVSPAEDVILSVPVYFLSMAVLVLGTGFFAWLLVRRSVPLLKAAPEKRWDNLPQQLQNVMRYWLLQWLHPRYLVAGILHIILFAGFLLLLLRTFELVLVGFIPGFEFPDTQTSFGQFYHALRSYASTVVLLVAVISIVRRGYFRPSRYETPERFRNQVARLRSFEALLVLGLIAILMISGALFEASGNTSASQRLPMTASWLFFNLLSGVPISTLQTVHSVSYLIHDVVFFSFLCFLPIGKHFHIITGLFNIFFMRLHHGNVRAVRDGISDDELDELESLGVKHLEDFSWKDVLDFYSCVDCGRCSDVCPANAVGRPLSPRFISVKARKLIYEKYSIIPSKSKEAEKEHLIGTIYDADEIWSCVTCGACEQECPIGIGYIDKIVDLRRGMVDEGQVPQSLQKPLRAIESKGNPFGKPQQKRADWAGDRDGEAAIKILDGDEKADVLYFVDSITSYDDRMHNIARATASLLLQFGTDFGILGNSEKDSGHEVRRYGEEFLFQELRNENTESIKESGACSIVTSDPHALNALKNDYGDIPQVEHISQFLARKVADGEVSFKALDDNRTYTFHDPCYLGRHNEIYEDPRTVIDAIPGLNRVEMKQCKDRSFCCGGGGLNLFYEAKEDERIGVKRVKMAREAGADVIVTACPNCMVNLEDAIKIAGFDEELQIIDLAELAASQLV